MVAVRRVGDAHLAVMRDGRVLEGLSGWPRGDNAQREALVAMLRRAGYLGPTQTMEAARR